MLPWSFSEEAAAEKHMPQLQHNMWVVAARNAVLSVITGGGKWVEIKVHADPLYQHLIVTAERKFWRCVESGEPPKLFGVEPPKPRVEAVRIVDMSASNAWPEFAAVFARTRSAHLEHEQAKAELQAPDARRRAPAIGHGVRASARNPAPLVSTSSAGRALMQRSSRSIGGLAAALWPRLKPNSSIRRSRWSGRFLRTVPAGAERIFRYAPLSAGLDIVRKTLGQHEIAVVQTTAVVADAGVVKPHYCPRARLWRVGRVRLARLRNQRNRNAASDGSGADLCAPLCPVHIGRNRGRG